MPSFCLFSFPSILFFYLILIVILAERAARQAIQAQQRAARAAARNQLREALEEAPLPPLPILGVPLPFWDAGGLPILPIDDDALDFDLLLPPLDPPPLPAAMGEPGEVINEAMRARIREGIKALQRNPAIQSWAQAKDTVAARHYAKRLQKALASTNINSAQVIRQYLLPAVFPSPDDAWLVHQPDDATLDDLLMAFVAEYDPLGSPAKAQQELTTFQRGPHTRALAHLTFFDECLQAAYPTQAAGGGGLPNLRTQHLQNLKNSLTQHHQPLYNEVRMKTTYDDVVDVMKRDEANPRLPVNSALIAEMAMDGGQSFEGESDPQTTFIPAQLAPPLPSRRGNHQPFNSPPQPPPSHQAIAALTLQLEEMQGSFTSQIAAMQQFQQQMVDNMQRYHQTERDRFQREFDDREQKLRQEQQQIKKQLEQQAQSNKQQQGGYNSGRQFNNQGPRGPRPPQFGQKICGRYYTDAFGIRVQCQGTDHSNPQHQEYMAARQLQQPYMPPRLQNMPPPPLSVAYGSQVQVPPPLQNSGPDHSTALVGVLLNELRKPPPPVYMPPAPVPYYGMPPMGMAPYAMQMQGPYSGMPPMMMSPNNFPQLGYQSRDAASPAGNHRGSS